MVRAVPVSPLAPGRFRSVLAPAHADAFDEVGARGSHELAGRVVWNVNSTASGGGVAEMLRSLTQYLDLFTRVIDTAEQQRRSAVPAA